MPLKPSKLLFIVNPAAGSGRCRAMAKKIQLEMAGYPVDYTVLLSHSEQNALQMAAKAVSHNFDAVIAVGGDGTVNTVLRGFLLAKDAAVAPVPDPESLPALGFIPAGTGNDLAKTLGLPLSYKEGLRRILQGHRRILDYGLVQDRPFINSASMGFDAQVVRNTHSIKKRVKSSFAYKLGVLQAFFNYKGGSFRLTDAYRSYEGNLFLVTIGNGKYYGGGYPILPMADMEDGLFHVCLTKDLTKLSALKLLPRLVKGTHINYPHLVHIWESSAIIFQTESKDLLDINIDGELVSLNSPLIFQIMKKGLVFIG